jgi:putative sterol carrier protein
MSELTFATQEWLDHFRQILNNSPDFRRAAVQWNDDALYLIEPAPAVGFHAPVGYYMKWKNGELIEAEAITNPSNRKAVYIVKANYLAWSEAHQARLDVGVAFLTGKFRFQGPFAKAAANLPGEVLMLEIAYDVPTRFLSAMAGQAN